MRNPRASSHTKHKKADFRNTHCKISVCTCWCSHSADEHRGDTQHQAEGWGGEAGHLSLAVRWGGQDSLVERLVGQATQSLE